MDQRRRTLHIPLAGAGKTPDKPSYLFNDGTDTWLFVVHPDQGASTNRTQQFLSSLHRNGSQRYEPVPDGPFPASGSFARLPLDAETDVLAQKVALANLLQEPDPSWAGIAWISGSGEDTVHTARFT